jgi:hypothetical protein
METKRVSVRDGKRVEGGQVSHVMDTFEIKVHSVDGITEDKLKNMFPGVVAVEHKEKVVYVK